MVVLARPPPSLKVWVLVPSVEKPGSQQVLILSRSEITSKLGYGMQVSNRRTFVVESVGEVLRVGVNHNGSRTSRISAQRAMVE